MSRNPSNYDRSQEFEGYRSGDYGHQSSGQQYGGRYGYQYGDQGYQSDSFRGDQDQHKGITAKIRDKVGNAVERVEDMASSAWGKISGSSRNSSRYDDRQPM